MATEDNTHVVYGPDPLVDPLPNISMAKLMYDGLLANYNKGSALVDAVTGASISYKQLLEDSCSLAESLRRSGYGLNTIISICSENNIEFYIPVIASLFISATVAPLNYNYTHQELTHCLNICKPPVIFCSKAVCKKFVFLKESCKFIERIIVIDSVDQDFGVETLKGFVSRSSKEVQLAEFNPNEQVAFVLCSSGTTGMPKGVMLTHRNLLVRYFHRKDPRYVIEMHNFLGVLPFFHAYGLITCFISIILGQQVVVMKRFEEELFCKTIQDFKINALWIAPPLVVLLAKSPLVEKYDLSCVEEITCGAAPLSKDTEDLVKRRLNIKRVRQAYGLTEATLVLLMMGVGEVRSGSVGRVVSYAAGKVRDPETGKSLGPGELGELCFKAPLLMKGYYGNVEATKNSFTSDGWLRTGDLGYYDQDHYFYVVDRLKELIKYKAFQVAPAELEAVVLSHPKVKDVGVVGIPDEEVGELPVAFVVKATGANVSEKELVEFVAERVSAHKRLRGGVIFVSSIPKNPSGKILRRELRKMIGNMFLSKL